MISEEDSLEMTSQLKYPLESQKSRFSNAFFTLCALLHGAFRGVVNLLIIIKINEWKIYESRKQSPSEAVSSSPAVWNWSQEHPEDDVITSDAFSSPKPTVGILWNTKEQERIWASRKG